MNRAVAIGLVALAILAPPAFARSGGARGHTIGRTPAAAIVRCPGFVVDPVQALKHGGADAPSNMQWQSKEAAREKDRVE